MARNTQVAVFVIHLLAAAAVCLASCGPEKSQPDTHGPVERSACDARNSLDCIEILRGEVAHHRWLADYEAFRYEDPRHGVIDVIRWADMVDEEVTTTPDRFRYQIYGTDGYTFGGYVTWADILNAYLDTNARRTTFDESAGLEASFNVKDSYRLVLSPAGD